MSSVIGSFPLSLRHEAAASRGAVLGSTMPERNAHLIFETMSQKIDITSGEWYR